MQRHKHRDGWDGTGGPFRFGSDDTISLPEAPDTAPGAAPVTIGFEDIDLGSGRHGPVPDGYQGLRWHRLEVFDTLRGGAGSGFETGLSSGDQAVFNPYATPAHVAIRGGTFDLQSVNLTSAWNISQTVDIYGYRGGVEVYHVTVEINDRGPTEVTLDFDDIRRVRFVPGEGIDDPALSGGGGHIIFDDFVTGDLKVRDGASPTVSAVFGDAAPAVATWNVDSVLAMAIDLLV